MKKLILFIFIALAVPKLSAQQNYFYTGKDYGSEANYNPVNLILNGSFDILQLDGYNRRIFTLPWEVSSKNVMKNLGEPFGPIKRFGWGKFLRNEIFPLDIGKNGAQWWPNYQLHLVGGGMTYTAMKEWYAYHNFSSPEVMSIATLASMHLINEFVENESYVGDNVDPISDIYVFDIGGIILFSFDNVNRFFSKTMNLADWSLQPSINYSDMSLHNNGQYFSFKWKLPFSDNWHLFYYCGMNGLSGASYKFEDNTALSFGVGLRAKKREVLNSMTNQQTIDMVWNAGVFYDRNNSLLASVFISGLTDNLVNINVYPGIIKLGNFSPGIWTIMKKDGRVNFGITTRYAPGLGF